MKKFGLKARDGIRISEGPKGLWMVYSNQNGQRKTFELEPLPGKALKILLSKKGVTSEDLRLLLDLEVDSFSDCLQVLRLNNLIVEVEVDSVVDINSFHSPKSSSSDVSIDGEPKDSPFLFRRIDKYTFELCDLGKLGWFCNSPFSVFARQCHSIAFLASFLLAIFAIWSFYHSSTRPLGAQLISDVFSQTSFVEVFFIVLFTQALTILYKICVGLDKQYSSSILYLKFMAGLLPVFEGGEDKPYQLTKDIPRWEYLSYICAPQVLRAFLLSLSILIIYVAYPFSTIFSQLFLKILLTNISISIITFFWALFPSPGTPSFKALEIYNIIPLRLVGISYKKVFSGISDKNNSRYKFALIVIALLLLVKISYLFFFLLPKVVYEVPEIFGTWTPQIIYITVVVMAIRFLIDKFSIDYRDRLTKSSLVSSPPRIPVNLSHSSRSNPNSFFESFVFNFRGVFLKRKSLLLVLIFFLLCPYTSNVAGSAKISEKMSLNIVSTEDETSFVKTIYKTGPSVSIVREGEVFMLLESPSLDSLISQASDTIGSLKKSQSILTTEILSLEKGSKFQEAKNLNETVEQNLTDINSLRYESQSIERQVSILESQVNRYRSLADAGALSEISYEDKLVELELKLTMLKDSKAKLSKMTAELQRTKRNQLIDQSLSISEELTTSRDKLKGIQFDLSKETKELQDLQRRKEELLIRAPFDCVIDSDTSLLLGKKLSNGNQLVSIRSVPSEQVIISVPEYDRGDINISDSAEIRLYSKISAVLHGRVSSVSPITSEDNDQEVVEVFISLSQNLPSNFIGATGSAKIRSGWTCLLWTFLKPFFRFIHVDLWSIFP